MSRTRFVIVATLVGAGVASAAATPVLAQKAPEFKTVLAGKKVEPPVKGQAEVEFIPASRKDGNNVITTIKVKNLSSAPIARLKIAETWFDKGGAIVGGSEGILEKSLAAGAVDTITIQTPWTAKMNGNSWNFSHANGTVKPKKVKSFDAPKEPAAAAAKPAAKKK
jgi:hypothetical protein